MQNNKFITNLTILTDNEKLFEKTQNRFITTFLISENSMNDYDFVSTFSRSVSNCDVILLSFVRPNSIYLNLLRTIYCYIYSFDQDYLLTIIEREVPSVEDTVIETLDTIDKMKEEALICNEPYILPKHISYITNNFYIVLDNKTDKSEDDINYWRTFYEPLLNALYKQDNKFKEIIDYINHKKFIDSIEFFGIRPLIIYVMYLIYKIDKVSDFDSMESLLNFSISIAYYIKNKNKIRDRFG